MDEWIQKSWFMCTVEYHSAVKTNAFESVLMRWMNIESIIHSESKSEKERQILYTSIHMESRKMVLISLFAGQQWTHRHRGWTYRHSRGRRR